MTTIPISLRVNKELLKKFDDVSVNKGYGRAEAIREAMRRFIGK